MQRFYLPISDTEADMLERARRVYYRAMRHRTPYGQRLAERMHSSFGVFLCMLPIQKGHITP